MRLHSSELEFPEASNFVFRFNEILFSVEPCQNVFLCFKIDVAEILCITVEMSRNAIDGRRRCENKTGY